MRIFHVDAFAEAPFTGNPAGVCLLNSRQSDQWMQNIAAEMNLSETAFSEIQPGGSVFLLRWFTPTTEVSLCGHATLATAHILWEQGIVDADQQAQFHTKSGVLTAARRNEWIELGFPLREVQLVVANPRLEEALGVTGPKYIGKYGGDNGSLYLLELESDQQVRELNPDFRALRETDSRATIVTAVSSSSDFDFVSRFFAPAVGIDEDPVTGSAHCYLAPFWAERLGKNELIGFQASTRTGVVRCRLAEGQVMLCGKAITVMQGELFL
jgi:PhzF family phenazine biosynthesis protein